MTTSTADGDTGGTASVTTIQTNTTKPAADSTDNTVFADVIGSKDDTALATPLTAAVTSTASQVRYQKTLMARSIAPAAADNATAAGSASIYETVGRKDDAAIYTPGTTATSFAHLKGVLDVAEKTVVRSAATVANNATLFTIAGGPIEVIELLGLCATSNTTASTIKLTAVDTASSTATDITAASASLATTAAGASLLVTGVFANAPTNTAGGTVASGTTKFIVQAGIIKAVVGTATTDGTFSFHLRYKPLARSVSVT